MRSVQRVKYPSNVLHCLHFVVKYSLCEVNKMDSVYLVSIGNTTYIGNIDKSDLDKYPLKICNFNTLLKTNRGYQLGNTPLTDNKELRLGRYDTLFELRDENVLKMYNRERNKNVNQ